MNNVRSVCHVTKNSYIKRCSPSHLSTGHCAKCRIRCYIDKIMYINRIRLIICHAVYMCYITRLWITLARERPQRRPGAGRALQATSSEEATKGSHRSAVDAGPDNPDPYRARYSGGPDQCVGWSGERGTPLKPPPSPSQVAVALEEVPTTPSNAPFATCTFFTTCPAPAGSCIRRTADNVPAFSYP